jgi:HEPN domain-containing protein
MVPDDPHAWLNRARSNLVRAQADIRLSEVFLEDLCFDAQQAAEKAIKAVLIHLAVRFPYVHDLTTLLDIVAQSGISIAASVREAGRLTRFAGVTCSPGLDEPVTQEEYEQAVAIAEIVFQWANDIVGRRL